MKRDKVDKCWTAKRVNGNAAKATAGEQYSRDKSGFLLLIAELRVLPLIAFPNTIMPAKRTRKERRWSWVKV